MMTGAGMSNAWPPLLSSGAFGGDGQKQPGRIMTGRHAAIVTAFPASFPAPNRRGHAAGALIPACAPYLHRVRPALGRGRGGCGSAMAAGPNAGPAYVTEQVEAYWRNRRRDWR